jgi:hypothetical protein
LLAADFSHQVAMMTLLGSGEWDFAAVRFPARGAISQIFLPYHGPRLASVPEAEHRLYQDVIRGTCRLLDQMLGKLVQAAGDDAAVVVVSAHGTARHVSPSAGVGTGEDEAWKSPHGIIAACGAGFASDALVYGATVLDVAPTVLTWFGLPMGDDMEGRVLLEGFVKAPEVARVASWEPAQPDAKTVEDPADNPQAAAVLRREFDWNLAQSCLDAARFEEALPILEGLFRGFPERLELGYGLFQCQLTLRKFAEAAETLEVVLEGLPAGVWPALVRAELSAARGDFRAARTLVNEARALRPTGPDALRRLGLLLVRLREWDALAELAKQALALDDNDAMAWLGLAEARLRKRMAAAAEEAALRAIGINYYLSQAHFVLARALVAQGKWQPAREAMQTLLQLQPGNRAAGGYVKRMG